jgi:hypothetical protein
VGISNRRLPVPASFRGEKTLFVGRENELTDIKKHLCESSSPLSIIGIGGIGKSVVCFKAIRESIDNFDNIIDVYFEKGYTFDNFLTSLVRGPSYQNNYIVKPFFFFSLNIQLVIVGGYFQEH